MTTSDLQKAFEDGAVFGRSKQTGVVEAAQRYASENASRITKTAKPGKATYCDTDCTAERCSEGHDLREVMIELY